MNEIEKEFIPYEQALVLKELGFDEPCLGYYYTLNGKDWEFGENESYNLLDEIYNIGPKFSLLAPIYRQAFKFFREKYNLYHKIDPNNIKDISYTIFDEDDEIYEDSCYWSYELAEEACLNKLIEICKNEQ